MNRFVKGKRKAIEESRTDLGRSKAKCRQYDGAYAFLLSASLTARASRGKKGGDQKSLRTTDLGPFIYLVALCSDVVIHKLI